MTAGPFSAGELYALRVGILLCIFDAHGATTPRVLRDNLSAAFKADGRVLDFTELDAPDAFGTMVIAAAGVGAPEDNARPDVPHMHEHVLRLDEPIAFRVNIPRRLQGAPEKPSRFEQTASESPPRVEAEEYFVAWDGVVVTVVWRRHGGPPPFGTMTGIAVLEIISEIVARTPMVARSQPCGDDCDYPFAHTDALLVAGTGAAIAINVSSVAFAGIEVACPNLGTPLWLAFNLANNLRHTSSIFVSLRARGQSVRSSEELARSELGRALELQYELAEAVALPLARRWRARWRRRSHHRQIARLVAGLWLRLAAMERNAREWQADRYQFDNLRTREDLAKIFDIEYPQQVTMMDTLDSRPIQAAVEQLSSRSDSRLVAVATAMGALGGALVAGALGLLS